MRYALVFGLISSFSACATTGSRGPQGGPAWTQETLVGTMWTEVCPGGNPAQTWLSFYEDGTFAYLYPEAEWVYEGNDTWQVQGNELVVAWNDNYASSRYTLDASGRLSGVTTKDCPTITLEHTGPAPDLEWSEQDEGQGEPGTVAP